jgi:glutaredoxin
VCSFYYSIQSSILFLKTSNLYYNKSSDRQSQIICPYCLHIKNYYNYSVINLKTATADSRRRFDRLTDRGSTGSPTVVRQAHQPWFDRLTNRGSTGSPTDLSPTESQPVAELVEASAFIGGSIIIPE